jgi:hypothetical protein
MALNGLDVDLPVGFYRPAFWITIIAKIIFDTGLRYSRTLSNFAPRI